ncbi:enoyl-CoA hydratase-related protein [Rhodococcus koreensis]
MRPDEFTRMTLTVDRGVGLITLNRPERRNAWAGSTAAEYRWALHLCDTDPNVKVVVLTGEGDFCVGADSGLLDDIGAAGGDYTVKKVELPPYPDGTPPELRHNHLYPMTLSVPIVAAIRGGCAGAGFLVATYADLRFVGESAKIASSFAGLGLPAEYGMAWLLPRMVGIPNAAQLIYSATAIDAERSAELGWAQRVCPDEVVVDAALEYSRALAVSSSGESLRMMKRQLFVDSMLGIDEAYRRSVADMNGALNTADFKEGVRALREKRQPNFV